MTKKILKKTPLIVTLFIALLPTLVYADELITESNTDDALVTEGESIEAYMSNTGYNVSEAVKYAHKNYGVPDLDKNDMECAEFVASCLKAGGIDIVPRMNAKVQTLRNWLRNNDNFEENKLEYDYDKKILYANEQVSVGDIIIYFGPNDYDENGEPPHAAFVSKIENNNVKITDRNSYNPKGDASWDSRTCDRCALYYKDKKGNGCSNGKLTIYAYHYVGNSDDDIASGTIDNIKWVINNNGKLTINGTGNVSFDDGTTFGNRTAWLAYSDDIVEAEVNISEATDLSGLFLYCEKLKKVDLSKLDTSKVTNMAKMFEGCCSLETIDVSNFNTSNVTNMSKMFATSSLFISSKLKSLDVSNFDTSNVTNMSGMFSDCGLRRLDLSSFNTSKVTDMSSMFSNCVSLENLNLSSFNTSNVVDMGSMFYNCNLSGVDVSNFNTSNVTDMSRMFMRCEHYYDGSPSMSFDVSGFDTSKVEDMSEMFSGFYYCTSINVSGFDTSNVTNMSDMFAYCDNLTSIDMSSFDVSRIVNRINYVGLYGVLRGCNSLSSVKAPKNTGFYSIDLPGEGWVDFTTGKAVSQIMPSAASGRLFIRKDVIRYKKGDATGDGVVAMGDVIKTARAVAGGINLSDKEKTAADVTGDGDIGMGDVVKLARFVAGSISEL